MSQDENAAAIPDEERDNLAELDGIGERYAAALAKAGVHSLSDLIKYTPKTLSEALKERAGIRISEKRIDSQNWIGQARQALGRKKLPIVRLPSTEKATDLAEELWEERSTFQIRFMTRKYNGEEVWQTRVYDDISGEEISVDGVRIDTWADWVLGQAGLQAMAEEARTHPIHEADAAQMEIKRLQNERDTLSQSLSAAQEEASQANLQVNTLENELQTIREEHKIAQSAVTQAKADVAKAKAEAESSAEALISVKQQAQAQIDAAFRAAAAAQVMSKPPEAAGALSRTLHAQESEPTVSDTIQHQASETHTRSTRPAGRPAWRVEIKSVTLEDNESETPRTGNVSFVVEGNQAPLVTRLAPCCVVEIRGVNLHGNASILLAKLEVPLVPNQFVYDVPFTLQALGSGTYELHTSLRLNAIGSLVTAAHRGKTIVQPSIAPSTPAKATGSRA